VIRSTAASLILVAPVRVHCELLAKALSGIGRIRVLATACDCEAAARAISRAQPGMVLIDLPTAEGIQLTRIARAAAGPPKIVVMGVDESEPIGVVLWARQGVSGCVARDARLEDLTAILDGVARGQMMCSPSLAAPLFEAAAGLHLSSRRAPEHSQLTRRELEVLNLVAEGLTNKQIARILHLQIPTVKNHVHNIFAKLHVHSRREAAVWDARPHAQIAPAGDSN
jgi:two-component system, NarL family, nitrate/nitrite response regulator NarL